MARSPAQLANDQRLREAAAAKRVPLVRPGRGAWMQTFTGRQFFPLNPRPGDVNIHDIAHALANTARFGGHTTSFYSVAQHSVSVMRLVPVEDALWGLLHDAAEAYLGDLPRPIKHDDQFGAIFRAAETKIMGAITFAFDLPEEQPASVEEADCRVLATERRDLMGPATFDTEGAWLHGKAGAEPLWEPIRPLLPADAEFEFLRMWTVLRPRKPVPQRFRQEYPGTGKVHWAEPSWPDEQDGPDG